MKVINAYSSGFFHWFLQRSSALLLITLLLVNVNFIFFVLESSYLDYLILVILVFHFKIGFETLIEDYIHNLNLKSMAKTLLRLIAIYVLKSIFFIAFII
jgi:succinate dehydrogenase hydrophobic anchor subunit